MRITLLIIISLFAFSTSFAQEVTDKKADKKKPVLVFEKILHDFGTIDYDGDGTCEFVYKNTGKEPLVLSNVQASCGCTIPEWSKEPLKKGGTAVIKVKYDTKRPGSFTKSITVTSNAKNQTEVLTIKGEVKPNENAVDENNQINGNSKVVKSKYLKKRDINVDLPKEK